jgi:hypothetical protein
MRVSSYPLSSPLPTPTNTHTHTPTHPPKHTHIGALNKSIWSKDGRTIMVGDAKGAVHLVSVQEGSVKSRCGAGRCRGRFLVCAVCVCVSGSLSVLCVCFCVRVLIRAVFSCVCDRVLLRAIISL